MTDPLITFTSDFGHGAYVAQVKGVLLSICSGAQIVDLSHDVVPGNVLEAAYLLEVTLPRFPAGVHLAVVDPGVGTSRRAIVVSAGGSLLVGPDNGIFTAFLDKADEVREIRNSGLLAKNVSATFHGRDVFGPVAAHLAAGLRFSEVGPLIDDPPVKVAGLHARGETGAVLHVDRFGNLVTSFDGDCMPGVLSGPGADVATRARTYGDAPADAPFLYAGSGGRLEVAVPGGSAAEALGWGIGTVLVVEEES